jgi:uncharacterized protein
VTGFYKDKVIDFQAREALAASQHDHGEIILIVATSGRMLAKAAKTAGFKSLVIDICGDLDTRSFAEETQLIPSLAKEHLLPAVAGFTDRYRLKYFVFGSGFEAHADSLKILATEFVLLGNSPEVFDRLQDKSAFFSLLKKLQIPYPEISFDPPEDCDGWLVKPVQSEGGVGIRLYKAGQHSEHAFYWQKFQEGIPHSVLFLADGQRSQVVGFNRQWTMSNSESDEFVFAGIINHAEISEAQKNQVISWLDNLVPELALKGLNSLDFIQTETDNFVLEINPRPPASMQLYDADLFALHIRACTGELTRKKIMQKGYAAYQVVYANEETSIPADFIWPACAADIPAENSIINAGQPICSIIAHGNEPQQVLQHLKINKNYITNQLNRFQAYGICSQR